MAGAIDARLEELGIELPEPAAPVANYVAYVVTGNLIFVSGQVPVVGGEFKYVGKVGDDLSVEDGQAAARLCGINIIAQVKKALDGDLDRVTRVVKLGGFVNSTPDFTQQPQVINGFSDLMVEVFGEDLGKGTRAAVGMGSLPGGMAVEVETIWAIRG